MLVDMVIWLIDSSTPCAVVCETSLSSTKSVISLRCGPETTTSITMRKHNISQKIGTITSLSQTLQKLKKKFLIDAHYKTWPVFLTSNVFSERSSGCWLFVISPHNKSNKQTNMYNTHSFPYCMMSNDNETFTKIFVKNFPLSVKKASISVTWWKFPLTRT